MFNQTVIPLRYSPRKMAISMHNFLVITESSHRMHNYDENQKLKQEIYKDHPEVLELSEQQIGPIRAPEGQWAACIRIYSP